MSPEIYLRRGKYIINKFIRVLAHSREAKRQVQLLSRRFAFAHTRLKSTTYLPRGVAFHGFLDDLV